MMHTVSTHDIKKQTKNKTGFRLQKRQTVKGWGAEAPGEGGALRSVQCDECLQGGGEGRGMSKGVRVG